MGSRPKGTFLLEVFALAPALEGITDVDSERTWHRCDIDPITAESLALQTADIVLIDQRKESVV